MKTSRFEEYIKYKQYELEQKLEKLKKRTNLEKIRELMSTSNGRYSLNAISDMIGGILPQSSNHSYLEAFIQTHVEFQFTTCT